MIENKTDSSCYAEGSYEEVVYCSVEGCNHEISRTEKTIDKKEHIEGKVQFSWTQVNPTGSGYWKCVTCGAHFDLPTTTTSKVEEGDCLNNTQTIYTATAIRGEKEYHTTYIVYGAYGDHVHDSYGKDATDHWSICDTCSEPFAKAPHDFTNGDCICGKAKPVAVELHSANVSYTVDEQVIIVTHSTACKVLYLVDGEYVAIPAVSNGDGSYSFTAPDDVAEVLVVVFGDLDADGDVDSDDMTLMSQSLLPNDYEDYNDLSDLQMIIADINGNGVINSADRALLARSLLSDTHAMYRSLSW